MTKNYRIEIRIEMEKKKQNIESEMIEAQREEVVEEAEEIVLTIMKVLHVAVVNNKRKMIDKNQMLIVSSNKLNQKKMSRMIRISMRKTSR